MYDLSGKVALVTGASNSKGFGCGIALRLAQEGADVAVTDRIRTPESFEPWDREAGWRGLDSIVEEVETMGRRGLAINADLTNRQEITDMVGKVLKEFGKIDILVNNAAIIARDVGRANVRDLPPVVELSEKVWDDCVAVNLTAVFLMCKAVAPQMIKRGEGGKIVNTSSIGGKNGGAGRSWYSATKFGLQGFTQSLARELGPYKINVNCVCPGVILTWGSRGTPIWEAMKQGLSEEEAVAKVYGEHMSGRFQAPMGTPGKREEVVNAMAWLASNQSDYITGQAINVCGGIVMH
ncbi:SDR family NAD(P)-dependent oxidoreductase [Chloroflexota bacterium]